MFFLWNDDSKSDSLFETTQATRKNQLMLGVETCKVCVPSLYFVPSFWGQYLYLFLNFSLPYLLPWEVITTIITVVSTRFFSFASSTPLWTGRSPSNLNNSFLPLLKHQTKPPLTSAISKTRESCDTQIDGYGIRSWWCLTLFSRTAFQHFLQFTFRISQFFGPLSTLGASLSLISATLVGEYWHFRVMFNKIFSETWCLTKRKKTHFLWKNVMRGLWGALMHFHL